MTIRTVLLLGALTAMAGCVSESTSDDPDGSASGGTGGGTAGAGGSGATGASAGSGGNGGSVNPGCQPLCDEIVAANCSEGPTLAGCLLTCKALTSSATCDPKAQAYFDCVDGQGVTCNAAGNPVATGCGVVYLQAIDCAVSEDPNPAIVAPCDTYCDNIVATSCPSSGTKDECNSNCKWLGATGTGCDEEWSAYLSCANAATFSCVLGFATPQGCGQPFSAYWQCVDAAGQ